MHEDTKTCTRCCVAKPRSEFNKRSAARDGLRSQCKECDAGDRKANAERNADYKRQWRVANCERERATERARYAANAERERERKRSWGTANPERLKAIRKRTREKYPERQRERMTRWREGNADAQREYGKRYRSENRDEVRRRQREWIRANYDVALEHVRRRRARLLGAPAVPFTADQLAGRLSMFSGCWMCGGPKDAVDHVKPLSKGGAHMLANLRPACDPCNSSKKDRWPVPTTLRRVRRQPSSALPAA